MIVREPDVRPMYGDVCVPGCHAFSSERATLCQCGYLLPSNLPAPERLIAPPFTRQQFERVRELLETIASDPGRLTGFDRDDADKLAYAFPEKLRAFERGDA